MKTDVFQSCGHCRVFQICWHIECSTFTASSFRIWNSSYIYVGINIYCAYDDLLRRNRNMLMNVIYKIQMYSLMCMCVCCCCCCCVASVVSDSVRLHRRQPTRLPRPRDSPGKNTGVVAISFSNAWKWKVKVKSLSRVWLFASQNPWDFPGKSPGMGCHCLLCVCMNKYLLCLCCHLAER